MEPIERDLQERKERQKRLAIELQRLEAIRPRRKDFADFDDHDRKLVELHYQLEHMEPGIRELEEIIAEKRRPPPKLPKPDVSRRRRLSDEERHAIAAKARADFLRNTPSPDDIDLSIDVERFTDLQGNPQIGLFTRVRMPRPPKPSRGS